ncbi:MAG: DMT family transporter [Parvibaculaceae bacterium]
MLVSELLAISAALCISISGMLISELKGRVDVFRLARWQMLTAFSFTAAMSIVVGGWRTLEVWQAGYLAASSFFGIIIASLTYFAAIYSAGPRLTALLFAMTAPFALLLGYGALGETITAQQGLGVALVLSGVFLAIGMPSSVTPASTAVPWLGIFFGLVTALGQALGSLCARPAMAAGVEPFTAMAMRSAVGASFFLLLGMLPFPALRRPYRFSYQALGLGVAASLCGAGLGMSLLMAALSRGDVGIVSTLSSMTPILILPMVWLRSGVAPSAQAWLGAVLAVAGTALISVQSG